MVFNVGHSIGEYQSGNSQQFTVGIRLTFVPEWIPRRFWLPDQVLYLEPPLYFRYIFTGGNTDESWYSNWVAMNTDSLLILDVRESSNWADDLEIVTEPGVTYTTATPGPLIR